MLYIISTPIGNLEDISLRALRLLKEVDLIAAEDTRRTGILLKRYEIRNKMISFNDNNKVRRTKYLMELFQNGNDIGLVSDSGTPGISDPGFYLVRECVKEGIKVIPVPGANAAISALVCSGLATDKFCFYGFLDKKENKKKKLFEEIRDHKETAIFYESPYRLLKTLKIMNEIIPDKKLVIARELTKLHEEFINGNVSDVYEKLKNKEMKGEFVLLIGGK